MEKQRDKSHDHKSDRYQYHDDDDNEMEHDRIGA
jgi:hypothetical protein